MSDFLRFLTRLALALGALPSTQASRRQRLGARCAVVGVLALAPLAGQAAFPGINGPITYALLPAGINGIYRTDLGQITSGAHTVPTWSPDGTQIAYYSYDTRSIMVANADGSAARSIAPLSSVVNLSWDASGENVWFKGAYGTGTGTGIWKVSTVGGGSTLVIPTAYGAWIDWSARSRAYPKGRLAYDCSFRIARQDICIYDPPPGGTEFTGGLIHQVPIDDATWTRESGVDWSPDGKKILIRMRRAIPVQDAKFITGEPFAIGESQIFSIQPDGSGLTQVTSTAIPSFQGCPDGLALPAINALLPAYSPDGSSIALQLISLRLRYNELWRSCSVEQTSIGTATVLASGGTPTLIIPDGHYPDWGARPADLTVRVDDGHGHPLDGLKVQLRNPATNAIVLENPIHNGDGTYSFEDVAAGPYHVRITLQDFKHEPGYVPAFEIRHNLEPLSAAWVEHGVDVQPTKREITYLPFDIAGTLVRSSVDTDQRERLDDMGAIYYQLQRFVAWTRRTLTPTTGNTVELYAFADIDVTGSARSGSTVDPDVAYYHSDDSSIVFGTNVSSYANRDAIGDESPENSEWHEFGHHLWYQFIDTAQRPCAGEANNQNYNSHDGYRNPDSCGSLVEGFPSFLATVAARDIDGVTDSHYADFGDLEWPYKAWRAGIGSDNQLWYEEDIAVASLFWDLYDIQADRYDTSVIGSDGTHQPVTYTDEESETLISLWNRLVATQPLTVHDLRYLSYGTPDLTVDLDEDADGVMDIARIDQVFLAHGFFPIDEDQIQTSTHKKYHYDVGYAQRRLATGARNNAVGLTSHRAFAADGVTVSQAFIPRFGIPAKAGSAVAVNVRDASGRPLSGAEIELVIQSPGQQTTTSTRRLDGGDGELVRLQLPTYYDYLLPEGAPMPACDPVNDEQVTVTVRARVNGYQSADTPSFDNCTFQQAVAASTGPAALVVTTTFPTDSTPPESTIQTAASDTLVGAATRGFWTVTLICNDPADSGFSAGCARIEYQLDNGPVDAYEDPVEVTGVGPHTLAYRSVDAAGNEESWRSIALDIVAGAPPAITDLAPASGLVGSAVAISGTDLGDTSGVTFNGVSASFTVGSATQVIATVPTGATSGPITITTPYGSGSSTVSFTVVQPPTISDFSPQFAAVGFPVTITGSNLDGVTRVGFNGTITGPQSVTPTEIRVVVPFGATSGPLTVIAPAGTGTSPTDFVVTNGIPPSITSFSPVSGAIGSSVTIRGIDLVGATSVTFNGVAATFRYKGSAIVATVPAGATTGPIRVTTAGGWWTTATVFLVIPPPTIESISPSSGTTGTTVTLTGSNFSGATAVKFSNTSASFVVVSPSTITATVPARAKSGPVSVTTVGGTATSPGSFTVVK